MVQLKAFGICLKDCYPEVHSVNNSIALKKIYRKRSSYHQRWKQIRCISQYHRKFMRSIRQVISILIRFFGPPMLSDLLFKCLYNKIQRSTVWGDLIWSILPHLLLHLFVNTWKIPLVIHTTSSKPEIINLFFTLCTYCVYSTIYLCKIKINLGTIVIYFLTRIFRWFTILKNIVMFLSCATTLHTYK